MIDPAAALTDVSDTLLLSACNAQRLPNCDLQQFGRHTFADRAPIRCDNSRTAFGVTPNTEK